jgi:hypothetical protein
VTLRSGFAGDFSGGKRVVLTALRADPADEQISNNTPSRELPITVRNDFRERIGDRTQATGSTTQANVGRAYFGLQYG